MLMTSPRRSAVPSTGHQRNCVSTASFESSATNWILERKPGICSSSQSASGHAFGGEVVFLFCTSEVWRNERGSQLRIYLEKLSRDFGLLKLPLHHSSFLLSLDISSQSPLLDSCRVFPWANRGSRLP
ncbi:uncharacterized protein LOC143268411 isoform X1 [Peromyscus maniculatus bairdii]|uniref:uncharacterized protein LOC143268411 isoform X1 n=1 Tax=Peromyscus maniculatus bairdii TaxID=230844 RepID=UPI003FCFD761